MAQTRRALEQTAEAETKTAHSEFPSNVGRITAVNDATV